MTARHAFPRHFTDAPSIQPERVPAHRAPKHRKNVPVDGCRQWSAHFPCGVCADYATNNAAHRAEAAS